MARQMRGQCPRADEKESQPQTQQPTPNGNEVQLIQEIDSVPHPHLLFSSVSRLLLGGAAGRLQGEFVDLERGQAERYTKKDRAAQKHASRKG